MFEFQNPFNQLKTKKKILWISDHPLSTSGVGTQSRFLINGLLETGKYTFRCFGGALKHENFDTTIVNPDFVIKPTNGFGDRNLLRQTLAQEKPDAIVLFTDPRFFIWIWEMEDEVHQVCPIFYNHLWDNPPAPEFNKVLYESTDLINCINHPTYEMVKAWFPERTNYIPHAVPDDLYFPFPDDKVKNARETLFGMTRANHFIVLFVGRNARRKMPSDIIASFMMFVDELEKKHGHRNATLVMHTDPNDHEGPNLFNVLEMLNAKQNVVFSKDRIAFNDMNVLYNSCDALVQFSMNEGFGLPVLEAKLAGKPVIALKTGGVTRQVVDHETGFEYGVGIDPDVRMLVGNQMIPYIYEDAASHQTLANAYMKVYEMGHEERNRIGLLARAHAQKHYDIRTMIESWDRTMTEALEKWDAAGGCNQRRWKITEVKP